MKMEVILEYCLEDKDVIKFVQELVFLQVQAKVFARLNSCQVHLLIRFQGSYIDFI